MLPRFLKILVVAASFMIMAGVSTYLTVHFLIRSENTVVVPELAGREVVYALELLSDLGLNTKVKASDYSHAVPRHHVISQDPAPGSEIKKGRDVRLIISKGARAVLIPNLTGIGLPQAPIFLEKNGLQIGKVAYIHSDLHPREEVLSQYPWSGTTVVRGDSVDLLVSQGPEPVRMAMVDLKGYSLGQAIEAIEAHRLVLNTIRTDYFPGTADDTVVEHSPASGYPIEAGGSVDLTINRIQAGQSEPGRPQRRSADIPIPTAGLFTYRADNGLLNIHLRVRVNRPEIATDIFDAFVKPGQRIWLLITGERPCTLLVYADDELTQTNYYD